MVKGKKTLYLGASVHLCEVECLRATRRQRRRMFPQFAAGKPPFPRAREKEPCPGEGKAETPTGGRASAFLFSRTANRRTDKLLYTFPKTVLHDSGRTLSSRNTVQLRANPASTQWHRRLAGVTETRASPSLTSHRRDAGATGSSSTCREMVVLQSLESGPPKAASAISSKRVCFSARYAPQRSADHSSK